MKFFAIPLLASSLALAACGGAADETTSTADSDVASTDAMAETGTVVDVAAGNPDFSTLVSAVTSAELASTLSGTGPFTVFAPTNEAFAKIPADTLTALMTPEKKGDLVALLTYHVVPGKTDAATLIKAIKDNGGSYEMSTVNGGKLTATLDGDTVKLTDGAGNTATVTATDVEASNGVIHVIDTVVMPK